MGSARSSSRCTRLIFLLLHLCPCFCELVTEEPTTDPDHNAASESLETPYSDSALYNAKQEADKFTLWQFKKVGQEEDNYDHRRVSHEFGGEHQYPPPHPLPRIVLGGQSPTTHSYPPYPVATPRSAGKHSKFRLPDFRTLFNKHKQKHRGRGQQRPGPPRPPHQAYAPSFISYGPIFGPPPVKDHNEWQPQSQTPSSWQSQPPSQWQSQPSSQWQSQPQWQSDQQQHRPSYSSYNPPSAPPLPPTAATYGTPNRPHYGGGGFQQDPIPTSPTYGTQQPTTRTYTHPPPTYGPTVRIHYTSPQTQQQAWTTTATTRVPPHHQQVWSPATTRIPPSQNQGPWNPLPPRQQNQWSSVSTSRTPAKSNYVAPTWATYVPPTGGYATPTSSYLPPNQPHHGRNQGVPPAPASDYGVPVRSYEPPMHFGQPMHNFGPPHSSYGQPPPIIGDPPQDRYAPKDDIYRYPTEKESTGNSYNSPRHRYDTYGEDISIEESGHMPSTDLYQTPRKPYRDPSLRKQKKNKPNPSFEDNYDYNDYPHSKVNSYTPTNNPEINNQGQYATDARPPPHYDTNYNSPGLSRNPKIVDWMPYSAKEYHQIPSRNVNKKQKAPKYRTLPKRLRDYRPDPEHVNYPKLTYDTLSRRMSEDENQTQFPSSDRSNKNKSEAETKTEIEDAFHEMLHAHANLAAMR